MGKDTARRLRELPDSGVRDAAGGWERRILRDNASWRGRAGVIEDPVGQFTLADVIANVVGGNDADSAAFVDRHARAIDAGAITNARQLIDPSAKISVIYGR